MGIRRPRILTPTHLSQIISTQKNPLTALQIFNQAHQKYPNYRHNGPVYATMINILGNSGRILEMKQVIHQMKNDSCECKDSVFVVAIITFASAGMVNEALNLFNTILQFNCVNFTESFNTILGTVLKESDFKAAYQLFSDNCWRISQKGSGEDIVIYRILLDALCDDGKVEEALEILGKVLRKGLKAPKSIRRRLDLNKCRDGEDTEATKRLIHEDLVRGGVPSMGSYSAMAIDLYNEGSIDEGDKVLDEMQDIKEGTCVPSVRLYNTILKCLCDAGDSELAVGYLKKMTKQVGCVATKESCSILVNGLCKDGKYVEASRVLEEMLIKSHRPGAETYNGLIKGLCLIGRQYEAVMWLEEMVSQGMLPDISIWKSLVASVCCKMSDIEMFSMSSF
ncbi:SER/ARG-rich protein 34A, putative isoform 1 [Hibiscus syriacus]|uniref:SER/ARG-rich protein 34A, putative isoform 1 n=1 Tax=Hibiscus syriacus TaxID=106335 RepID=A0A6A3CZU5_HIBSY|nr:SER/ARG-rich protein 34A, putative isoform 1 [Hibiscus syriacus]